MIQGLILFILFTLVVVALLLRAMFRSTNEGVKRLRTALVIFLAGIGLAMLFQAFSPWEAVFVLVFIRVVTWIIKGFRKG